MVHDDTYNVKYRHPNILYESVLFEPLQQIRISHAMFRLTSYTDFGPYIKVFLLLRKRYNMIGRTVNGHREKP